MTQPDFQSMDRRQLRAYVLQHRDDLQAVRVLVDKLMAESSGVVFPAPKSIDDLSHFADLLRESGREQKES